MTAYVQRGNIIAPNNEESFDPWKIFHTYSDYSLIVGNRVGREKMKEMDSDKKVSDDPAKVAKQLLEALDKLRPEVSQGNADAQFKRALLCGRDGTIHHTVDILEGLSETEIASFKWDLTPSQHDFIFSYCRQIYNGVAMLQGPPGSDKTTMIKALVEIAAKCRLKVAIVTHSQLYSQNLAAPNPSALPFADERAQGPRVSGLY